MGHRPDTLRARLRLWSSKRALQRIDLAVNTSGECAFQVAALGGPSGMRSFTEIPQVLETLYPKAVEPRPVAQSLLYLGRIEANKGVSTDSPCSPVLPRIIPTCAWGSLAQDRPMLP